MIRPATLAMFALAAGAGGLLFQVSFEVSALEDRLVTLNRAIVDDQDSIHVLRAEWSCLNQPSQLETLAQRYLDLVPLKTEQIQSIAALPLRPETESPDGMEKLDGAALLLAAAKGLPKLKPVAPRREARPDQGADWPRGTKAIVVAQRATEPPVTARTLGDVLNDVMKPIPARAE
ncbi:MAG: cell division protein FtsL [Alphaproteobacteria bacterium]